MIIQPLVENAVIHGIGPKIGRGRIVVRARRIDSKLRISVQDDGVGFDCRDSSSSNGGIGLQNIRSRVMTIDPTNTVRIDSKPGAGTTVTFEIPIESHDKEGDATHANTDR
jgi:sensor histidine kinase YesM